MGGLPDDAEGCLSFLEGVPENAQVVFVKASVHLAEGRRTEARLLFERVLELKGPEAIDALEALLELRDE